MSKKNQLDIREKKNKVRSKKKNRGKNTNIMFILAFGLALLCVGIALYYGARYIVVTLKYKEYKDKMDMYYLSELYNNGKADSIQKVENNEMIKVIIGSVKNTKDINDLYYTATDDNSLNIWYKYSIENSINTVVENNDENPTKIDAAIVLVNSVEILLGEQIQKAELKISDRKLATFTPDEKDSIAKAVTLGLIENKSTEISNSPILKGELNKMIINIVEKYSTIYYGAIKEGTEFNLVTDKGNMPSNYEEYPYIIDSIDNEIYELKFNITSQRTSQNPRSTYETMGNLYMQIDELIVRYFDNILNVDYTKITEEKFLNGIKNDVVYVMEIDDVKEYVKYVRDNKIKLEGKATPLLPIIYNNGEQYVVRTKIEFKILNSNTDKNILFGDENYTVNYTEQEIIAYVDVPMGMTLNGYSLRIHTSCMARYLAKESAKMSLEK